jgi:putative two-component system response regulator
MESKILIIDSRSSNITTLTGMLNDHGYQDIKSTKDPRTAVDIYKVYQPDLLLLSLTMHYMNGFQVLDQLRQLGGDEYLPVIVISAGNDRESLLKALEMGAKDFIAKPFDSAETLIRIKNILDIHMLDKQVKENNRQLEKKVLERTRELQTVQIELIQRLFRAAEFRDNDTGNHIVRIGALTYELGLSAGLPAKYCSMLRDASMMHDIGKIGIPDDILLKPGKLDAHEWEKMKTHTINGAQILTESTSELICMAERIALTHHEKWDGSGYPLGLKGENIPIEGRITAICDVFDALLTDRPYKKAWPLEDAVGEIKKGRGAHFDPGLVDIFLEGLHKYVRIREMLA